MQIQNRHILRALMFGSSLAAMLFIVVEALRLVIDSVEVGRVTAALLSIAFGVAVAIERFSRLHFSVRKGALRRPTRTLADE